MEPSENPELKQDDSTQTSTPKSSKSKHTLILVVASVLTALVVGIGVYLWMDNSNKNAIAGLEKQVDTLTSSVEQTKTENDGLKQQVESLGGEISEVTSEKEEIEEKTCTGVWKNGICVKSTCVDSDVNEKPDDIYIKGNVTYTDDNGVETVVSDSCTGSKEQVNETWCYESPEGSGNYVQGTQVTDCDNGCLDGACLQS